MESSADRINSEISSSKSPIESVVSVITDVKFFKIEHISFLSAYFVSIKSAIPAIFSKSCNSSKVNLSILSSSEGFTSDNFLSITVERERIRSISLKKSRLVLSIIKH